LGIASIHSLAWLLCGIIGNCFAHGRRFVSTSIWEGCLWMRVYLLISFFFMLPIQAFGVSTIRSLENRIRQSRDEVDDLRENTRAIVSLREKIAQELKIYEEGFEAKFNKVLLPLLSWPVLSLNSQRASWSERQEGRVLLDELKSRLVAEPLRLMADRELHLRTAIQLQGEYESKMAALEKKQNFLKLQLEELKDLQRKSKAVRPKR
jgi:uncharacterized membrane protein